MSPHTFLFTDVVGEGSNVVLDVVERNGASMLEFTGTGWMVTFTSPRDAVDAAIGIRRSLPDGNAVRIAVHAGRAEDVVLAAHLMHEAAPGEIVVSSHVVAAFGPTDLRFEDGRVKEFSGLGSHLVYGVRWAA